MFTRGNRELLRGDFGSGELPWTSSVSAFLVEYLPCNPLNRITASSSIFVEKSGDLLFKQSIASDDLFVVDGDDVIPNFIEDIYLRPDGVSGYFRPDGESRYIRP